MSKTNASYRVKGDLSLRTLRSAIINAYVRFKYLGPIPQEKVKS